MKEDLYNEFVALVDQGDEEGARAFLVEHLNDFSPEVRKEVAFAFFMDAVKKEAAIAEVQEEGLKMMNEFDKVEEILADASKAADLRESI